MSLQTFIQGITNWASKPAVTVDGTTTPNAQRMGKYNELAVVSYVPDMHMLADEGSYFISTTRHRELPSWEQQR